MSSFIWENDLYMGQSSPSTPFLPFPTVESRSRKTLIRSISVNIPLQFIRNIKKMKSLLLLLILLDYLANGEEQFFDGQAEIALEKALDDMRLGVADAKEMANISSTFRRPIPPVAPPRASSAEQNGINLVNSKSSSSIPPMLPPFVVLINPPSPLQMAKSHANPGLLANFVVRPNEPKRIHKFEFMPHFDKENYEFMIPEGGQMEEDTLVAVLTFFGHLNGEIPKFDIKMDRLGWFSIGNVQTTDQESNNYALSEVPILRRANAKINWTDVDNADGIYKFKVNGIQGPMNASAQIRVEILPTLNYTHLELEPSNEEEKKVELKNITIGLEQSTVDSNGNDEKVKDAKEPGEDLLANEQMDEKLLRIPLGLIDLTEGDELFGIEEEQQNMTIQVHLNGEQSRNGQVEVEFTELSTYLNNPVANFVVNFEEIHKNAAMDLTKNIVRLELRPANAILDIRPHFIAPGDEANLWIVDPVKVAELTKENGGEWQQQFKLFVHQMEAKEPIIGNGSFTILIFNGSLMVKGGGNPMPAINFTNSAVGGYEFAINEGAKNGHVLGKLEVETTGKIDGRLVFSIYGQGAEIFQIDEIGILRLDCHQNIISDQNSTFPGQCLDSELGSSSFYFVASASITNSIGQNLVAPVPITINVEDANDNPPRLELFKQREIISIIDGQIEGGPLVVAIRDEDSLSQNRENRLWLRGNCSKFFAIQQLKNSSADSTSSYPPLFTINFAPELQLEEENCEHLELVAGDQDGQIDRREFKIIYKTSQQPFRFINPIYERSINADKIHIGLPIVRMQLANNSHSHREMNLNYVIIDGNPGWLAIEQFTGNVFVNQIPPHNGILRRNIFIIKVAAIQNHIKLAESLLKLEILANSAPTHSDLNIKFPMPFIQMELDRLEEFDQEEDETPFQSTAILVVPIFEDPELALHTQLDGMEAWDDVGRSVEMGKEIDTFLNYSPQNGSILINSSLLGSIRSLHVHFKLDQGKEEEKMLLALTFCSDPIKAEQRRRRLSRPRFVTPWVDEETLITIKIAEELPIGQPFFRLPAFNPLTGKPISQIRLEGPDADSFIFVNKTGEIRIGRRLNFESSARFQQILLIANSSESDRPVQAQIQIELLDVDDTPPKIRIQSPLAAEKVGEIVGLEFEENPPKNKQLGILEANDPDSRKHNCELVGKEADKFILEPIKQNNAKRQWRLSIDQMGNDELDRERMAQIGLVIRCVDFPGQNRVEMPILFTLLDQNDNRPILNWVHQGQEHIEVAAKEWPKGGIITRFWARDLDIGENGRVQFQMGSGGGLGNELFRIDSENGELMAANDDTEGEEERPLAKLAEMLAGQMLELEVVARDNGRPSLSSSAKVRILLEAGNNEGQRELHWIWPDNEGAGNAIIEVGEDVPEGRKIGKAEAIWRGGEGGDIFYKIGNAEDGGEEVLRIDQKSGEIFTASKLDYESRKHWTFLVTAFSLNGKEELNAIFELNVLNIDEYWPQFSHSLQPGLAKQTLYWPMSSSNDNTEMFLGRVEAFDLDSAPFNRISYSLVSKCSHPSFLVSPNKNEPAVIRLNPQNGEIYATTGFPHFDNISTVQICILASYADHPFQFSHLPDSIPNQSIIRLQLLPNPYNLPSPKTTKIFPANNSHSLLEHRLSLQKIGLFPSNKSSNTNFSLYSVLFTPYGQSFLTAQKIGSMDAMRTLIGIDPHEGELRFDPAISGAFGEGFYQFGLKMDNSMGPIGILNRNVHFVEDKHRLRLLFNASLDSVSANLVLMIRKFEGILSGKMGNQPVRVIHSEPIKDSEKQMFRSSMCFHLWTLGDSILGMEQTIRLVSTNIPAQNGNEHLAAFYEQNAIINVEPCLDSSTNYPGSSTSSILLHNSRSKEWLFWSCFGGISLLILFSIFGYFCFVRTYREHLRRKSGDLLPADERSDSSTFHQYLNNQFSSASVFSVPEFIHAKALMSNILIIRTRMDGKEIRKMKK